MVQQGFLSNTKYMKYLHFLIVRQRWYLCLSTVIFRVALVQRKSSGFMPQNRDWQIFSAKVQIVIILGLWDTYALCRVYYFFL